MSNSIKVKGLFLSENECFVPSAFTQSKVFQVISKNNQKYRKLKSSHHDTRTKYEAHSYKGFNLDLKHDYPLLHLLLCERQKQNSDVIEINLNELLRNLGMQVRPENREKIYYRIRDLSECQITVLKYNGDGDLHKLPYVSTRLVLEIRRTTEDNFSISFPPELASIAEVFDSQLIKFDDYKKIKLQSAKGIFLTIRSHAFISINKLTILFKKFKVHYHENRTDKQIAQDLKEGFEHLLEIGFIKSYQETKTKNGSKAFRIIIKDKK